MVKREIATTDARVLDLFAGAGGFSLGFHWAGFKTAVALDHNKTAIKTLEDNFKTMGLEAWDKDLSTYTPNEFKKELKSKDLPTNFDIVIGGPPCQGWSKVGRGKIRSLKIVEGGRTTFYDPRNRLYRRYLDFISAFKPKVAVMENVPGMLWHKGKNIAEQVADSLGAIGYEVTWLLLNASHYGVPQNRERLIFVGVRKDIGIKFEFPDWKSRQGKRHFPFVTVEDAIGDLPIIRNGARKWIRPYKKQESISGYGKFMRANSPRKTISDHVCRDQNAQDLEAFGLMKQGGIYGDLPKRLKRYREDIFDDKYKKLYWNRPSWCVTAHLGKDCYTHIHPSQARTISVREAARIQSFPDWFRFSGGMNSQFTQIGNAVPPVMSRFIATAVKEQVFEANEAVGRKVG